MCPGNKRPGKQSDLELSHLTLSLRRSKEQASCLERGPSLTHRERVAQGEARTQISQIRDLQKRVNLAERGKAQGYLKHGWELWAQ